MKGLRLASAMVTAIICWAGAQQVVVAAAAPMRLDARQLKAAAIETDRVTEIAAPAGGGTASLAGGIQLQGQVVVPNESVEVVLATVAGQLESVAVNIGQAVRAGQALGRIYSAEMLTLQRDYLHARSQAELRKARLARDQALLADGIVSAGRLQETEAAAAEAAATYQQARQLLRLAGMSSGAISQLVSADDITPHLTLVTRSAGVLLEQAATVGQRLQPGDTVFRLSAGQQLNLELQAARADALRLRVGDLVRISGCDIDGRLSAIGAQLNALNQTVSLRAQFPRGGGCLRPNEYVQVIVTPSAGAAGLLSVAAAAITRVGGRDYVFVQEEGGFRPVAVTVFQQVGDRSWVRSELRAGQAVVRTGVAALKGSWQGLGAATGAATE
jgi:multidrug efflux pump subunit AcrA (membrane-fusion protein)